MRKIFIGLLLGASCSAVFAVANDAIPLSNSRAESVGVLSSASDAVESLPVNVIDSESSLTKSMLGNSESISESAPAHKPKNYLFQKFDNEYNIGYSISQFQLANGGQQQTLQQNQNTYLEVERLFDVGVWVDGVANFTTATNSLGNQATGTGQGAQQPASQVPNLGGINFKVGYAFQPVQDTLQVTPYGLMGRNSNLAMSTIVANNFASATNDVFNTAGFGARLEYRVNPYIQLYADQSYAYNWDQSEPLNGVEPQNNYILTSVLGAKFNVYDALQLGVNGFYSNYQYVNNVPSPYSFGSLNGGNASNGTPYTIYQPQNVFGGMITVGLTY